MGELAEAEAERMKDPAYAQNVALGNAEFEREVAQFGGPTVEPFVDADKANVVPIGDWNLLGLYRKEGVTGPSAPRYKSVEAAMKEVGFGEFKTGEVHAIGAKGSQPDVWSHEFGHRRFDVTDAKPIIGFFGKEKSLLLWGAFRARSEHEWQRAIDHWIAANPNNDYETDADAEKHLKKILGLWSENFVDMEVAAMEKQGNLPIHQEADVPMKGFFNEMFDRKEKGLVPGSLKTDVETRLERRKKNWNIDKE